MLKSSKFLRKIKSLLNFGLENSVMSGNIKKSIPNEKSLKNSFILTGNAKKSLNFDAKLYNKKF